MTSWLRGAVGYEIYVRSFMDANGDGFGDLEGVRRRLDHLVDLGVDVVWLTPITPSPDADHGYDCADYYNVDQRYGSLADFDRLVADVHDRGMRLVTDLVPNHTSSQHPWFLDALTGPEARFRDWYVWRDPAPDGGPPNNWRAHFGGPAWSLDPASGQYYMHLFLPEQPDLNWHNPEVRREFQTILQFWLDRGIDGFRIDVAHSLTEDPAFRDNPIVGVPPTDDMHPKDVFAQFDHVHDVDQDDAPTIYEAWRPLADAHDAALIGEVYLDDPARWARYVAPGRLHTAFWFETLHTDWDAEAIRRVLADGIAHGGAATSWPVSSHDDPYAVSRFGGGDRGRARSLAYLTLLSALPGTVFLQQGEELGLENALLPPGALEDPMSTRNDGAVGRDGTRTPMPWEPGHNYGFSPAPPWIPVGANRTDADTAAVQRDDPSSHLNRLKRVFTARRAWRELPDDVTWLTSSGPLIAARRGPLVAVMNLGGSTHRLPLTSDMAVAACSSGRLEQGARLRDGILVEPDETVVAEDRS